MTAQAQQFPITSFDTKSLHQLVNFAAANSRLSAVERHSFIINEVTPGLQIAMDEKILVSVLNQLLSTVVNNTKHSCIRIEAKEYDDVIFITVKDNSSFADLSVSPNFAQIKLLAMKLNGSIRIVSKEKKMTSILLSFPNFPIAC